MKGKSAIVRIAYFDIGASYMLGEAQACPITRRHKKGEPERKRVRV